MKYQQKKDSVFFHPVFGRIVRKQGMGISIHWSKDMLDYLRRNFPTMLNQELAECLGVSQSTMIRKAREMGLEKDKKWLQGIWDERRHMAHSAARRKGYPGGFKKGQHANLKQNGKIHHEL